MECKKAGGGAKIKTTNRYLAQVCFGRVWSTYNIFPTFCEAKDYLESRFAGHKKRIVKQTIKSEVVQAIGD